MIRSMPLSLIVFSVFGFAAPALADLPDANVQLENIGERRDAVTTGTADDAPPLSLKIGKASFTLSGLVEIEGSCLHVEGGADSDDLRLSTVQIGLETVYSPWLSGRLTGLWEEGDTEPMIVDEAVMTLILPWKLFGQTTELYLGRQYLPFGSYPSGMISDPLTLELGETHTTALILALESEHWRADIGSFEGSVDDGDDGPDSWVLAIEATPREGLTLGASWISDLAESDAKLVQDEGLYRDDVPGWSAFVAMQHGDFGLTAEYLAAIDQFEPEQTEAGGDLTGRRPQTWNLELSWQVTAKLLLASRFEAADDYQADVRRYGATVSYGLCNYALLAVEYLYADADGDDPAHAFTAQLAVEF